ncbi:MAG: MFS transporter [Balneolaceae bacterium]
MSTTDTLTNSINRDRLFKGICLALFPTGFSFVLVSNILYQLKTEFILTNAQVGLIGGAALWGMAVSLLLIGPFLEKIGLKKAMIGAFVAHLAGVTLFLAGFPFAGESFAFYILFMGAIGFGAGNGLVEIAGNPMVAALYPDRKTVKLNHFHAFFPGSMILGGLLGFVMAQSGLFIGHWTWQIAIIYIPIFVYGFMIIPQNFPKTETAEAGIPTREMFRYVFTHPLVWGLILIKMVTLSLEMGPMRWIPEVLQAAGVHGMLVFVWISGVMMLLRFFAGPFVEKFSPTGMLLGASVLSGIGLILFAFIEAALFPLMIAATIFAAGVAFFFPTMVGLMSERFPKAGSLGIVLLIGMGFFAAGGANAIMGSVADNYLPDRLDEQQTVQILERVESNYPEYIAEANAAAGDLDAMADLGYRGVDAENALTHTRSALEYYRNEEHLDGVLTGNALRAIIDSGLEQEEALIAEAVSILRPADNYGGRMSFLWVAPVAFLLALIFLVMYIRDRRQGGYKVVRLGDE